MQYIAEQSYVGKHKEVIFTVFMWFPHQSN